MKRHDHVASGGLGKLLVEFGHVAVMADTVGVKALGDFGEQHVLTRRSAGAGDPRLGVDHDLVGIDRLGLEERDERKLGAGRVAAGIGDEAGRLDLAPVDFGQAVHRLLLQLRRCMRMAVPARIGGRIGETEIGREIDDLRARRARDQVLDHLLRRPVWQRAEDEIELKRRPIGGVERRERRQPVRRELRKHIGHGLPGPAVGREQSNRDVRMSDEQANKLRPGIARGAKHADLRILFLRGHDLTLATVFSGLNDKAEIRGAM